MKKNGHRIYARNCCNGEKKAEKNHDFKETRTPPARFTASNQLSHEVKEMPWSTELTWSFYHRKIIEKLTFFKW